MNSIPAIIEPPDAAPFRWTVDTLYRALDAGVFDRPERLELIRGALIEKMGQNPAHASLISRLTRHMRSQLEPQFTAREEKPLHIADDSEPVPDIMVVVGSEADYADRHPTAGEVALLLEVADSTAAYDTRGNALLYAQAAIADYWVVVLTSRELVVHRRPAVDGYGSQVRISGSGSIAPLAAPDVQFDLARVFEW